MRQRNSYSRIIQDPADWSTESKGSKIKLFQHCIQKDITSFLINTQKGSYSHSLGTAFSESGLSRDEIQFIALLDSYRDEEKIVQQVEEILQFLDTDYLDLLFLDFSLPSDVLLSTIQRLRARGKIVEIGVLENKPGDQTNFLKDFPASATLSIFSFSPAAIKTLTLAKEGPEETSQMLILESGNWENEHEELRKVADKYQVRPKELLFSWLLHHEGHFHPVIHGNTEAVVDSAVKAFHTKLIEEDFKKLPEKL
ncbi:aldo/keto reductase [Salinimicrobium sp. CAU 1759]